MPDQNDFGEMALDLSKRLSRPTLARDLLAALVTADAVERVMAGIGAYVDDPGALYEHLTRVLRPEVTEALAAAVESYPVVAEDVYNDLSAHLYPGLPEGLDDLADLDTE